MGAAGQFINCTGFRVGPLWEPISIIDDIPEALRGRVALVNGVLHISAELKNNLQIVDFYGSLRRRGILTYEFHKPEEFDNTYQAQAAKTGHAEMRLFSIH